MIPLILITAIFTIVNVIPLLRFWLGRWPCSRSPKILWLRMATARMPRRAEVLIHAPFCFRR